MDTTRPLILLIVPTLIVLAVLALKDRAVPHLLKLNLRRLLTLPLRALVSAWAWAVRPLEERETAMADRLLRMEVRVESAMAGQRWLEVDRAVQATEVQLRLARLEERVERLLLAPSTQPQASRVLWEGLQFRTLQEGREGPQMSMSQSEAAPGMSGLDKSGDQTPS